MNIREELLEEHSKRQSLKIAAYISNDAGRFAELIHLFLNDTYRVTQRAAWVVSHCAEKYPALIAPHLAILVKNLERPELHDAVKRNTVRILQYVPIPYELQGAVADLCFRLLLSREPVAVKANSMTVLLNLCRQEPGLRNELRLVIEEQLPEGSAAILSRGRKVLKELEKM